MNKIRTKAATITGTCYAQKMTHSKYLPQFFVYNNKFIYHHIASLSKVVSLLSVEE